MPAGEIAILDGLGPFHSFPEFLEKFSPAHSHCIFLRVATVREKSGKNKNFSRSGKSQGILQKVRENLSSCQSQ